MPWSEPAGLAVLAGAAFLLSALGTAWARRHGLRRGLVDAPGERRSHAQPTPRGGGIGIVVACLCVCTWLANTANAAWWFIGAGLLLTAAAGWWDDHRPLSPWIRLGAHMLAGVLLAVGLHGFGAALMAVLLVLLATPMLVNAWNFMDGIDGLAASQAALYAAGLVFLLPWPAQAFALVVFAACLGFLPFNLPVARIFLGDVGSGALGYLVATLAGLAMLALPVAEWPLLLLPASAFLVDAGLTLSWRAARGERWWTPHVQHLYQRMARRLGHGWTTRAYAGWTAAAVAIMLAARHVPGVAAWMVIVVWFVLAVWIWIRQHHRHGVATEGIGK